MTTIERTVLAPFRAFADREDAGRALACLVVQKPDPDAVVLAAPRGGVPVAEALAQRLDAPLHIVLIRKLPIPASPEMGFGAVGVDGSIVLNDEVVRRFRLSSSEIAEIAEEVLEEVRRRAAEYVGGGEPPDLRGRRVYLVDDGLATGYTMITAAQMVRRRSPERLVLCVPVSPVGSIVAAEPYFDDVYCLIAQELPSFAVASFYARFPDLTDEEVRRILSRRRLR